MKHRYLIRFRPLRITLVIVSRIWYLRISLAFCIYLVFFPSYSHRTVSNAHVIWLNKCQVLLTQFLSLTRSSFLSHLMSASTGAFHCWTSPVVRRCKAHRSSSLSSRISSLCRTMEDAEGCARRVLMKEKKDMHVWKKRTFGDENDFFARIT